MILVTGCGKQAIKKTSKTVESKDSTVQPIKEEVKTVTETKTAVEEGLDLGVTSDELDDLEREFNEEFVEDIDILGFE